MGTLESKSRSESFDIIAIGDTTTDLFLHLKDARITEKLGTHMPQLCINFADKIPLEGIIEVHGVGNAANNAVGSSRLGLKTALWTIIGNDRSGKEATSMFRREGVSTRFIKKDKKRPSNYSVVINVHDDRTILVHHEDREYRFPKLPPSQWVYLTSMGKGWERIRTPLLRHLEQSNARLGFNPGTHQMLSGSKVLRPFMEKSDVFIVNVEEAQRICNTKDSVPKLLRRLHECGVRIVVITDGINGSHAFDGTTHWHLPIFPDPRKVVERTGAGDAYSTGFLGALAAGKTIPDAMLWGSANSRSVVQHIGAQEGLQTRNQIQYCIRKYPNVRPKKTR